MTTASQSLPWWKHLDRSYWFVFVVASLVWLFDCLDQQLFLLARESALTHLLRAGTDPTIIKQYAGYATSIVVLGWASGGLIFGSVGDKVGRAKTLTLTVFIYSICTGLSAFSQGWIDFAIFRFLTGVRFGSYPAMLGDARWRKPALFGMLLCVAGVIGLWGSAF